MRGVERRSLACTSRRARPGTLRTFGCGRAISEWRVCFALGLRRYRTERERSSFIGHSHSDLDLSNHEQISIYNGRGILIESADGPVWMYGTASEHNVSAARRGAPCPALPCPRGGAPFSLSRPLLRRSFWVMLKSNHHVLAFPVLDARTHASIFAKWNRYFINTTS